MREELIFKLRVKCAPMMVIGETDEGVLRVIPITGGTFTGKVNGTIIPGGADWNTQVDKFVSTASAKYVIQTEDGFYISVQNDGVIDDRKPGPFPTKPRFTVDKDSPYNWLNNDEYIGKLSVDIGDGEVEIGIFKES